MKTRSIFEKFLSSSDGEDNAREFVAEHLESRILYSAAPALMPQAEVAHEASASTVDADFESIETFMTAAKSESPSADEAPVDKVSTLASFDQEPVLEPVRFESAANAVRRWDSPPATQVSAAEPEEFTIVALSDSEVGDVESVGENVFVGDFQAQNRLTALRPEGSDAIFGLDQVKEPGNVLGLGQIAKSMSDWMVFAA